MVHQKIDVVVVIHLSLKLKSLFVDIWWFVVVSK